MPGPDRKAPPPIEGDVDKELNGVKARAEGEAARTHGVGQSVPAAQAEPKNFLQRVDFEKLKFGQKLIGWCLFLIVALTLVGYFVKGDGPEVDLLRSAIELFKLVTTTALGFVFAKTQIDRGEEK